MIRIGSSQNFLRTRMNRQSSSIVDMAGPFDQNWFFIDDFRALSCSRGTQ